jgi:hypothetical protein
MDLEKNKPIWAYAYAQYESFVFEKSFQLSELISHPQGVNYSALRRLNSMETEKILNIREWKFVLLQLCAIIKNRKLY